MGEFNALMRKNWILYKRGCCGNVFQLVIPIFFIGFIIMVSKINPPILYAQQSYLANNMYSTTVNDVSNLQLLKQCPSTSVIGLAPSSSNLITKLNTILTADSRNTMPFATEAELETYIRSSDYGSQTQICWGVVVESEIANGNYQYKLRFNISSSNDNNNGPASDLALTLDEGIDLMTYQSGLWMGMVGANHLINDIILQIQSANTNNHLQLTIAPAYQEQYLNDQIYANLGPSVGTIFLLPLLILYLRQTSSMLSEKESKVRESMRIMGMKMRNYYLTWFIRYFAVFCVVHGICTGIIYYQLPYIPFYIPLILFLLFDIVIIVQNFFIQVFLSRAKLGVVIALLFFVLQFVASLVVSNSSSPDEHFKTLLSIVPHVAFILGFSNMLYFESKQITADFSTSINNYTLKTALFSFVVNIIVYLFLLWYLDQVIPSEWGAKRHPLFCCCEKHFERTQRIIPARQRSRNTYEEVDNTFKAMEKSNDIIEIADLRKEFNGGDLVAVDNLNLKIYKNQIFVLLGHNGAGKTTTISMLTGITQPTEGFISVFGESEIDTIRSKLGLCPQHDTLYEDLTVEEHLNLFATFKGLDEEERELQVNKLINDVNLQEKRDEYTKNLSGGQKRRLSVAIAFAGKSRVIILDEPTSGMDTSARRYIWDLLKTYKNDRIIILTTHFMDEADFLGDRIGIMGSGKLLCCGSSIFLKNRFGIGYNITFVKDNSQVDSQPIIRVVQRIISDALVLSNVSSEVSMQLPLSEIKKFSSLFHEIEVKKAELKVAEYGISITTLQQVFLKVGEENEEEEKVASKRELVEDDSSPEPTSPSKVKRIPRSERNPRSDLQNSSVDLKSPKRKKQSRSKRQQPPPQISRYTNSCTRFVIHFKATFLKRFRVIKRDLKTFLFELALPLGVIICALLVMQISFIKEQPAQYINLSTYTSEQNPVVVPIGSSNAALRTSISSQLTTQYGSQISLREDTTDNTASDFDQNYLSPLKKAQATLKGGIYFEASTLQGASTVYPFYSLVVTRSPTSTFLLPSLAAQSIVNSQFSKSIQITVANHPMPLTYQQLTLNNTISGFLGSFIFTLALAFKFASIIALVVKEREDRVKHQQIVSGMKLSAYWFANFVYDYALYVAVAVPSALLCSAMKISSLSTGSAYTATWLLFCSYGLAYIPFTYIIAFLYKEYGSAQSYYFFLTFLIGGMFPVITFVLRIISTGSNQIGRYISWAFRVYPAYAFGQGIINLGSINAFSKLENNSKQMDPFSLEITVAPIIYLFGEFLLYMILLFIIQAIQNNESMMRCFSREGSIIDSTEINESDVRAEYQLANDADPEEYEILTKHLRKVYMVDGRKKYKVAVDNMSFGIKRGEVFGLLGVNGAGKSTTFKMLSGQITSTSGDSYFCGLKISENLDTIRESLGYCPQFDALVETLTVREQIQLYYDLKSLDGEYKDALVTQKIKQLDLLKYEDKLSGTLSGGNKRKLSVALAMIGSPKIIFLDQPSTGMDPKARRFMWKIISQIATERKQSTIILTTHSMEEAEALSTRLAIMVKGNFQCIGTPQHIKSKYGEGMEVEIKFLPITKHRIEEVIKKAKLEAFRMVKGQKLEEVLKLLNVSGQDRAQLTEYGRGSHIFQIMAKEKQIELDLLIQFLQISFISAKTVDDLHQIFGEIEVLETLQTFLRLKVRRRPNIGKLFDFFQSKREYYGIQQYTIKQASVQQIFNKFAQNQAESSNHG